MLKAPCPCSFLFKTDKLGIFRDSYDQRAVGLMVGYVQYIVFRGKGNLTFRYFFL